VSERQWVVNNKVMAFFDSVEDSLCGLEEHMRFRNVHEGKPPKQNRLPENKK